MAKLYVITDNEMNVDTFVFLQQNNGAAGSYFYNWVLMQQHRNFSLYTVGGLEYVENQYMVSDIDRQFICKMPEEDI
ncbi:hypothetical protein FNO19_00300 [Salmonella enterica subsp. salamae]|nr:hypothetical protein [Salmonella enterica subsp. salamae]SQH40610.1 Uncharacterised protein [Salmonella enterica]